MNNRMTKTQFDALMKRLDDIEDRMVTKHDVFQSVMTVQAFFAATVVGCIVVLNAMGAFS